MESLFANADAFGPEKIVHLHVPSVGLKAILVIDNTACGPSIGGVRMAPDVSIDECARLARAMTYKNAAAGLPHGGGKSVIFADPRSDAVAKETLIRAFAKAIGPFEDYIVGPDMGTNETCMAWVRDEIGRSVGLPGEIGGIPLDEIGATGLGVAVAADIASEYCNLDLNGARVAVQGFGAVGKFAARFLAERGCVLVAAADSQGAIYKSDGIDVEDLIALKNEGRSVAELVGADVLCSEAIVGVDCDIWIPAARPDVLRGDNVGDLKARLVLQGANIPATSEAERLMHERGIVSVPDFIANAGGVICASVEYHGGSKRMALETIVGKVGTNTRAVLESARDRSISPRAAAMALAQARLKTAMNFRRF
jgi:glutamate dehydrogenase (NAD(P)+)